MTGNGQVARAPGRTIVFVCAVLFALLGTSAAAQGTALKQAVAEAAAGSKVLAAYYKSVGYDPLWTGRDAKDRARRKALLAAFEDAADHGLPVGRYDAAEVEKMLRAARKPADRGKLDVALSRMFLAYASDISTGILDPRRVNEEIARRRANLDETAVLEGISRARPGRFIASLAPRSPEYARLVAAKIEMQKIAERDAWGPKVNARRLEPGDTGDAVVALRNRLIRMGFMKRTVSAAYDARLTDGVKRFQAAHGLATDGITGPGTLSMLNASPDTRLAQIIVAMERERWLNFDRGDRHIEVNIPDFRARIIDDGKVTFETITVLGAAKDDWRTPEFSDEMEFMVVNPSWYVPDSIAINEYLPLLQEDPFAVSHLELLNRENGETVDRRSVDFASLDEDTWSFLMKEPPSQGNALGLVKFMFPNKHNIYLHDTPQKSFFAREARAFSHGCIRLREPLEFAHTLLARQTSDPEGMFQRALAHDEEYQINLDDHVPVHIIYRTARVNARGQMEFRRDVYRRDAEIFSALRRAGVDLRPGAG